MNIAPYPFDRWPSLRRVDVAYARRASAWLPSDIGPAREAIEQLLGTRVELGAATYESCAPGELPAAWIDPVAALVLVAGAVRARLVVELSPGLAASFADRVLGGPGTSFADTTPLEDGERGALAYLGGAGLATSSTTWRIAGVVTTERALRSTLGLAGCVVASAPIRTADGMSGTGRVWIPHDVPDACLPARPETCPAVPITIRAEVGETSLTEAELNSLSLGDVVLLDAHFELARCRAGRRTTWWCNEDGQIERIETRDEPAPTRGETMNDEESTQPARALGDTPIALTVEIARVSLPLEEVSSWRVGTVVAVGRRVGETVTLRAGDEPIAEGELVDIDGEVGVRLTRIAK